MTLDLAVGPFFVFYDNRCYDNRCSCLTFGYVLLYSLYEGHHLVSGCVWNESLFFCFDNVYHVRIVASDYACRTIVCDVKLIISVYTGIYFLNHLLIFARLLVDDFLKVGFFTLTLLLCFFVETLFVAGF